jgi:hypothetical protein
MRLLKVQDSSRRRLLGHQATEVTRAPTFQTLRQAPVSTSHSLTVPSSPPVSSHCPALSGATLRTCSHNKHC